MQAPHGLAGIVKAEKAVRAARSARARGAVREEATCRTEYSSLLVA